ncbi:glycogen synthase [Nocardioides sp. WL0053]|jgi:alpha-maltose-1-phosphate synthase|uniref:Glycogen synthase n=1 Tax=Nocardioides jiangsuensis TaxID=2866161 RepID=A0ABS7RJG0_9ACTN|nr:glycogen synthase [Nocardioides jiangsuensis]MBY9075179.1 glycogen synthase [Nocardioides jiangsuensis]
MRAAILTREFPPDVYGGAGVHVDFLVRELRRLIDVDVHCMGEPREGATAHSENDPRLADANAALRILSTDLSITAGVGVGVDVVHSHTWYANMAGHWSKLLYDVPHVVTAHSLEPQRPWKAEQLGGGYRISSWAERTAYESADAVVAVSQGMRADVLTSYPSLDPDRVHVVYNGIDTDFYRPDPGTDVLERIGVDPSRPYVAFVGRITRQKGVPHLLRAGLAFDPSLQVVLLAGAADTPELKAETDAAIAELRASRDGVFVVSEMLPREQVRQVLTHALAFLCPSVYEPLGIVNLEAMACETAVVASRVGGIPEVVLDGETGLLVDYDEADPAGLETGLAEQVNKLAADPGLARRLGEAGRARAVDAFAWDAIAQQTVRLYESLR